MLSYLKYVLVLTKNIYKMRTKLLSFFIEQAATSWPKRMQQEVYLYVLPHQHIFY